MYFVEESNKRLGENPDTDAARAKAREYQEREAFDRLLRDCAGVPMLRRLTRTKLGPIAEAELLTRRLQDVPNVFARKREMDALLKQLQARQITVAKLELEMDRLLEKCDKCPKGLC